MKGGTTGRDTKGKEGTKCQDITQQLGIYKGTAGRTESEVKEPTCMNSKERKRVREREGERWRARRTEGKTRKATKECNKISNKRRK